VRMRLNRFLSRAGVASRRRADTLLLSGRVSVNGEPRVKPGSVIDTEKDIVEVDGRVIHLPEEFVYVAFNKPKGVLTTLEYRSKRPTIRPYIMAISEELGIEGGLVYVGRLDGDTHGLLLLTNDGSFANKVAHPRYEVEREYIVIIDKKLKIEHINHIEKGIYLNDGMTLPAKIKYLDEEDGLFRYSIIVREGRKRLIRRIFRKFNYNIIDLMRVRIGGILLGGLGEGEWRELKRDEASLVFKKRVSQ